jgi:hypothetical protein
MSTDFSAGLEVSVLGLLITFAALGIFILIIMALKALFPAEEGKADVLEAVEEAPVVVEMQAVDPEGEVVAAIAAALMAVRTTRSASLGQSLQQGRGSWWAAQRADAREGGVNQR